MPLLLTPGFVRARLCDTLTVLRKPVCVFEIAVELPGIEDLPDHLLVRALQSVLVPLPTMTNVPLGKDIVREWLNLFCVSRRSVRDSIFLYASREALTAADCRIQAKAA
jgi:hypothetical protein